jgi:hypothetical protein
LLALASCAAGRLAELLGVEVGEQLAGPVVAAHGDVFPGDIMIICVPGRPANRVNVALDREDSIA